MFLRKVFLRSAIRDDILDQSTTSSEVYGEQSCTSLSQIDYFILDSLGSLEVVLDVLFHSLPLLRSMALLIFSPFRRNKVDFLLLCKTDPRLER